MGISDGDLVFSWLKSKFSGTFTNSVGRVQEARQGKVGRGSWPSLCKIGFVGPAARPSRRTAAGVYLTLTLDSPSGKHPRADLGSRKLSGSSLTRRAWRFLSAEVEARKRPDLISLFPSRGGTWHTTLCPSVVQPLAAHRKMKAINMRGPSLQRSLPPPGPSWGEGKMYNPVMC